MARKALMNPEIKKHVTSEYLIKGQYLDRSKFGRCGMGCSYLGKTARHDMNDPIMKVSKLKK